MSETNERSVASTGSAAGEPVAWGVVDDRGLQLAIHATPERAGHMAKNFGVGLAEIVPLYRRQQPTLTDAEREAIADAISCCEDITYGGAANQEAADVLKALLERTK